MPGDIHVPNNAGKLAPGIDLRSDGYIATGGKGYEWQTPLSEPLAECPEWLHGKIKDLTKPPTPSTGKSRTNVPLPQGDAQASYWLEKAQKEVRVGNRNDVGFNLALQLRDSGVSETNALNIMTAYAHSVPQAANSQYTVNEAVKSLAGVYNGTAREPATLPRKPRAPVSLLPEPKVANELNTPPRPPEVHIIPHIVVEPEFVADFATTEASKPGDSRPHRWSVAELYDTKFPEPRWIIPGLIPVGLTLFAGRPKAGKSLYMMNVAAAVGSGGHFWDKDVIQGEVLYLFLEDSPRVLKDRMLKMHIPRGAQITWERDWRPLHDGGLDDITVEMVGHDYRLIVIDTLATSLPGIDHNKDQVTLDYVLNNLHKMAVDRNMGLVCNDHTRKGNGMFPDPIDDISGNSAKSRNADHILGLYLEPGKQGATLKGKGREVAPLDLNCHFDQDTFCWTLDGAADDVRNDSLKGDILRAIQTLTEDGDQPTSTKIAKFLDSERANVARGLADLLNAGKVRKGDRVGASQPYYLREVGLR
jgi:hypothetical protein